MRKGGYWASVCISIAFAAANLVGQSPAVPQSAGKRCASAVRILQVRRRTAPLSHMRGNPGPEPIFQVCLPLLS